MIRVGLVGFGMAGRVFHAPTISAVDGLELAAVVERSGHEAELRYPTIAAYPSLETMLTDASLELIVIATPNLTHSPLALQALEAGRHVVVDKPVGISSDEISKLAAVSERTGQLLIPYHNRRWDNGFRTLQKLLHKEHEESVGRVVFFESTFDRWRPRLRPGAWREKAIPGSGILLDLGTHLVDEALQLFGLPLAVSAEIGCERDHAAANDAFSIRLRYGGLSALLSANCLAAVSRPHYTVRGTQGAYVKWGLDPQEARLKETGRVDEPGWGVEPASGWGVLTADQGGTLVSRPIEPIPGDYRLFYAGVRDAILGKSVPPVLPIDAWRAARVLEWAEQSFAERREIRCEWNDWPS
jgi:predicted dehydrogenase